MFRFCWEQTINFSLYSHVKKKQKEDRVLTFIWHIHWYDSTHSSSNLVDFQKVPYSKYHHVERAGFQHTNLGDTDIPTDRSWKMETTKLKLTKPPDYRFWGFTPQSQGGKEEEHFQTSWDRRWSWWPRMLSDKQENPISKWWDPVLILVRSSWEGILTHPTLVSGRQRKSARSCGDRSDPRVGKIPLKGNGLYPIFWPAIKGQGLIDCVFW